MSTNRQIRVLLFSNWLPPVESGSAFYTASLGQALLARGHEVVVATLDWGPAAPRPADMPFPVHRLPALRIPQLPLFYNLKLMGFAFTRANHRRLRALVSRYRPHILHHVNHIFDTIFLSVTVARSARIPVVGSITTPVQHQNPWMQRAMSLADRLTIGRFGVRRWDGIVSLDQMVHQYVGQLYGDRAKRRSQVIPFGVRLDAMSLYNDRSVPKSERPQICTVGHIHPFRNPVQLVRAMPLVLDAFPDARLVLAGRVDLQEPVKAARQLGLTTDQVAFLGPTPHGDVIRLMKTSHMLAVWATGPYPGLGTAAMEAMLCETPVINDLPEDLFGAGKLKHGQNIVLVDSHDRQRIADAIIDLFEDEKARREIGSAGRRFVLEHLSWDSIAEQMERFYAGVLAEYRR